MVHGENTKWCANLELKLGLKPNALPTSHHTSLVLRQPWEPGFKFIQFTTGPRCDYEFLTFILALPLQQASGLGRLLNRIAKCPSRILKNTVDTLFTMHAIDSYDSHTKPSLVISILTKSYLRCWEISLHVLQHSAAWNRSQMSYNWNFCCCIILETLHLYNSSGGLVSFTHGMSLLWQRYLNRFISGKTLYEDVLSQPIDTCIGKFCFELSKV